MIYCPYGDITHFSRTSRIHFSFKNSRPHSPLQTLVRSLHALLHNYTMKSPLVTMGRPKFTPKVPILLGDLYPHLIHPSLDRPHSPPQTASRSKQPFFHNSPTGQTDTPIDRWDKGQTCPDTRVISIVLWRRGYRVHGLSCGVLKQYSV